MKSSYAKALSDVLVLEGGKVDHPKDPGGRTAYGVTQRVYDGYRRNRKLALRDVWLIDRSEIEAIYKLQYWDKVAGDRLPAGVDLVVFDGGVNSGPAQSIKWLQAALGVRADGVLGEETLGAVEAHPDHDLLIAAICARRMRFLRALRTWSTFGKGWSRRVAHVEKAGQAIAMGSVGPKVVYIAGAETKARLADAKSVKGKAAADLATGAGGASALLTKAADQLAPAGEAIPMIGNVASILLATATLITVGGILYRVYATYREKKLAEDLQLVDPGKAVAA